MIHQEIEFHNAASLESFCGLPGLAPVRFPKVVRKQLNRGAKLAGADAAGVELRFVTPAPDLRLAFTAHHKDVDIHVYCGDCGHSDHTIAAGTTVVLPLTAPDRFRQVETGPLSSGRFSPDVWRILISGGMVSFLGLETFGEPVRPPDAHEVPSVRWLAYGSSITHSWAKGYPQQAARRLGVDVLNKGLGGSCHCEPEIAVHLADSESWDFTTLELGVNMRSTFQPGEFEKRVLNLLARLRAAKPKAPLVLITHFLNAEHFLLPGFTSMTSERQNAFDEILRKMPEQFENVTLFEGRDILRNVGGLSCDLLHPSDYGHMEMGENLARLLHPVIAPLISS